MTSPFINAEHYMKHCEIDEQCDVLIDESMMCELMMNMLMNCWFNMLMN